MHANKKPGPGFLALAVVFVAALALGYFLRGPASSPPPSQEPAAASSGVAAPSGTPGATEAGHVHEDKAGDEEWTCVMHPWIRLPKPGKCPICGMELVSVKKSETGEGVATSLRQVKLSPSAQALARVETVPVARLDVEVNTRLFGKVAYDESRQATITAWVAGRLDRLYVNQTGVTVAKGQKMAEIYSPELLAAQGELIEARKALARFAESGSAVTRDAARSTEQAAREKLSLLGLSPAQIEAEARRGVPTAHVVLTAPIGGVVVRKDVVEGVYVATGARLYAIADLSTVWVELEAYEKDLPWVNVGDAAHFEAEALPGRVFDGKVVFIDPFLNDRTRTVRVRLEVPNPDGALKPGMVVHGLQKAPAVRRQKPLVIPASAPLVTGKRAIVYVAVSGKEGVYEGREIVLGPRAGSYYVVQGGLEEGEQVVTRGSFMIDSSAQIEAKPSMMNREGGMTATGHVHGGAVQGAGVAPTASAVPPAFLENLMPLAEARAVVGAAVAAGDLPKAKEAFADFRQAVLEVDPRPLSGHLASMWQEMAMLLGNDGVVGQESASMTEAKRRMAELDADWKRVAAAFPMNHKAHDVPVAPGKAPSPAPTPPPAGPAAKTAAPSVAPAAAIATPPAFQTALGKVMAAYTVLQQALAQNDLVKARLAAEDLRRALAAVPMDALSSEPHTVWMTDRADIDAGLAIMAQSQDLEGFRKGFNLVSSGLAQAVAHFGAPRGP